MRSEVGEAGRWTRQPCLSGERGWKKLVARSARSGAYWRGGTGRGEFAMDCSDGEERTMRGRGANREQEEWASANGCPDEKLDQPPLGQLRLLRDARVVGVVGGSK